MKTFLLGVMAIALCMALTYACSLDVSPVSTSAGGDMTAPKNDEHTNLGPGESCGTANEKSGCHGQDILIRSN